MDPYKYLDEYEVRKAEKVTSPAILLGSCRSVRKILNSFHRFFCCFFFFFVRSTIQMYSNLLGHVEAKNSMEWMPCKDVMLANATFGVGPEHQHENMNIISPAGCRKLPDFFTHLVPNMQCIFPFSRGEREYLHLQQLLGSSEKQLVAELRQAVFGGFGGSDLSSCEVAKVRHRFSKPLVIFVHIFSQFSSISPNPSHPSNGFFCGGEGLPRAGEEMLGFTPNLAPLGESKWLAPLAPRKGETLGA